MKGPNIALAAPHPDIEMGTLQPTPPVEVGIKSLAFLYDCFRHKVEKKNYSIYPMWQARSHALVKIKLPFCEFNSASPLILLSFLFLCL